jgi:hypothetical protein
VKTFLLVILISLTPLKWTGEIWTQLGTESKLSYASGLMGGLLISAYLKDDPYLAIRNTTVAELVTMIDLFYIEVRNRNVPLPDAIMLIGGKEKPNALHF